MSTVDQSNSTERARARAEAEAKARAAEARAKAAAEAKAKAAAEAEAEAGPPDEVHGLAEQQVAKFLAGAPSEVLEREFGTQLPSSTDGASPLVPGYRGPGSFAVGPWGDRLTQNRPAFGLNPQLPGVPGLDLSVPGYEQRIPGFEGGFPGLDLKLPGLDFAYAPGIDEQATVIQVSEDEEIAFPPGFVHLGQEMAKIDALAQDEAGFAGFVSAVYGDVPPEDVEALRQKIVNQEVGLEIEGVPPDSLPDPDEPWVFGDTVYVPWDGNEETAWEDNVIADHFIEGIGHWIDDQLRPHGEDSRGDEGEIFQRAIAASDTPSAETVQQVLADQPRLLTEEDHLQPEEAGLTAQLLEPLAPGQTARDKELVFQMLSSRWDTLDDASKSAMLEFVDSVEDPVLRQDLVGHVEGSMAPPPVSADRVGEVALMESEAVMQHLADQYDPSKPSDEQSLAGQLFVTHQLLHGLRTNPEKYEENLDVQEILDRQRELMSNTQLAAELDTVRYHATHDAGGAPIPGADGNPAFPTNEEIDDWADYLQGDDFAWRMRFAEFPDELVRQNLGQFAHIVGPSDLRTEQIQETVIQHAMVQRSLDNLGENAEEIHAKQIAEDALLALGYTEASTGVIAAAIEAAVEEFPKYQTTQGLSQWITSKVGEVAAGALPALADSGFFDGVAAALTGASFAFTLKGIELDDGWDDASNYFELGSAFFATMSNGANAVGKALEFYENYPESMPWHHAQNPGGTLPSEAFFTAENEVGSVSSLASEPQYFFDTVQGEIELANLPPLTNDAAAVDSGAASVVSGTVEASDSQIMKWAARATSLGKWAGVVGEALNFGTRVFDIVDDVKEGHWGHLAADSVGAGLALAGGANLLADSLFAAETASLVGGPAVGLAIALGTFGLLLVEELAFPEDEIEKAARPMRLWHGSE